MLEPFPLDMFGTAGGSFRLCGQEAFKSFRTLVEDSFWICMLHPPFSLLLPRVFEALVLTLLMLVHAHDRIADSGRVLDELPTYTVFV